nr:hypothetical protein BaRGS_027547 [Batillaria attramentaria]
MDSWVKDLLLRCGDVEPNPGPFARNDSKKSSVARSRSAISLASMRSAIEKRRREIYIEPTPLWCSCRLVLAFMGFLGFVNVYAMRVNLSVAMVCMINQTAIQASSTSTTTTTNAANFTYNSANLTSDTSEEEDACGRGDGGNSTSVNEDGEFAWPKETQGLILGSFFWGYMTTQILGGWLSARFGGKRVYGWFMCSCAICTLLMPVAARTDYRFLLTLRFLAGVGQGVTFPAMNVLWANWAPPLENSKLGGLAYSGSQVGNVITFPLAGLLCEYGFDGGWPSIFYVLGVLGLLWFVGWTFIVFDSPAEHPRISPEERDYITTSLKGKMAATRGANSRVPWCTLLKSPAVWGIIITHTCSNFGTYTFLTNIPTYMKEVLHFDIKQNGLLSSLPYIGFWLSIVVSGQLADIVRSHGMLMPGIFVAAVGYMTCERSTTAVTLLTLGVALSGFQYGSGWMVNPVDIAPVHAGVIFGISNTFATIPGFVAPVYIGLITKNQTQSQWQIVFFIATAIYTIGALAYIILGSGEIQDWARQDPQSKGKTADSQNQAAGEDEEAVHNGPENDLLLTEIHQKKSGSKTVDFAAQSGREEGDVRMPRSVSEIEEQGDEEDARAAGERDAQPGPNAAGGVKFF